MIGKLDMQSAPSTACRDHIALAHGGGGQLTDELIQSSLLPRLGNDVLNELLDSAIIPHYGERIALTIDGYVVQPLKFPGGDIGRLAVCGTVNDLAVIGARPLGIALGFILAEGLERRVFDEVVESIRATANEAGVNVVTGDTKVVGKGHADGMYVTTAGIGVVSDYAQLHPSRIKPGDALIINAPIADHGLAVMLAREMPGVDSALRSDVAPLNKLIDHLLRHISGIRFMRDPTRGGLAGLCADLASRTGLHIELVESQIPIRPETLHAAEMLGLDPLEVANEGKVVIVTKPKHVDSLLAALKQHSHEPRVIGHVGSETDGLCELVTKMGGRRIIQKPYGEQLPRIC